MSLGMKFKNKYSCPQGLIDSAKITIFFSLDPFHLSPYFPSIYLFHPGEFEFWGLNPKNEENAEF